MALEPHRGRIRDMKGVAPSHTESFTTTDDCSDYSQ